MKYSLALITILLSACNVLNSEPPPSEIENREPVILETAVVSSSSEELSSSSVELSSSSEELSSSSVELSSSSVELSSSSLVSTLLDTSKLFLYDNFTNQGYPTYIKNNSTFGWSKSGSPIRTYAGHIGNGIWEHFINSTDWSLGTLPYIHGLFIFNRYNDSTSVGWIESSFSLAFDTDKSGASFDLNGKESFNGFDSLSKTDKVSARLRVTDVDSLKGVNLFIALKHQETLSHNRAGSSPHVIVPVTLSDDGKWITVEYDVSDFKINSNETQYKFKSDDLIAIQIGFMKIANNANEKFGSIVNVSLDIDCISIGEIAACK